MGEVHGQRFVTDTHTRLHLHTGDVSPDVPLLVVPDVGLRSKRHLGGRVDGMINPERG